MNFGENLGGDVRSNFFAYRDVNKSNNCILFMFKLNETTIFINRLCLISTFEL